MERKQVSWLRVARRVGLFWALLVLVFGLIFATVGGVMAWKAMTLARDGVTVTGEVLETHIRSSHTSDGATRRSYHVTYRFIPEGEGTPLIRVDDVSQRLYWTLRTGGTVEVTHARHNPDIATVDLRNERMGGVIFTSVGVLIVLVGLGLGGWMIGRKLSVLRALREGEVREARVKGIRATDVYKNKVRQYVLDWVDASGTPDSSMVDRFEHLSAHPEGSVITVYIDPQTGRGWWEAQI